MSNRRKRSKVKTLFSSLNGVKITPAPEKDRPGEKEADARNHPGPGAINVYRCNECTRYRVVGHVDKGVTPAYLACPDPECVGTGVSMMYPNQENIPDKIRAAVRWEWYRPGKIEFTQLTPEMQQFVSQGGLVLREKV